MASQLTKIRISLSKDVARLDKREQEDQFQFSFSQQRKRHQSERCDRMSTKSIMAETPRQVKNHLGNYDINSNNQLMNPMQKRKSLATITPGRMITTAVYPTRTNNYSTSNQNQETIVLSSHQS